ncbi:hypothetical protein KKG31_00895 [Patescibacteria group bacterium]|nr:hypothetical protein [Patescibacteria group bacterium]MBU1757738.1 hypothetical protein [Patescibacteria group bacterium]
MRAVQEEFPIIADISMEYVPKSMLRVTVDFFELDMLIKNQDLLFGVYKDYTFQIYSGNTIGQGKSMLYLPRYASGLLTIDGLFFRQSANELREQMDIIYPAFPKAKFIAYLPGAERTVIMTFDDKKVFLSNIADVAEQIKNFELLRKYYTGYVELREIDLGSLDKDKVIVKK